MIGIQATEVQFLLTAPKYRNNMTDAIDKFIIIVLMVLAVGLTIRYCYLLYQEFMRK